MAEAVVARVEADGAGIWLEPISGELPRPGEESVLLAVVNGVALLAEGTVLAAEGAGVALGIRAVRRLEERREVRVAVPGARVTLRGSRLFLDCPVLDLSTGGIQIRHGQELPPGTDVEIVLTVPLLGSFEVGGSVVWTREEGYGLFRSGIAFDGMPEAVSQDLHHLCQLYAALLGRAPAKRKDDEGT